MTKPFGIGTKHSLKRLRLAWVFKCWPWQVPVIALKYLQWPPRLTARDIQRTHELARKYGWK